MKSPFDNVFADTADTFHDVFGADAEYTIAATDETVPLKFNLISLEKIDQQTSGSRSDCWILTGTILVSDVPLPARGDLITLDDDEDDRKYQLTQTPTTADDGLHWDVEFRHEEVTRRGGNPQLPIGF
ncbi:MAG: hypothetical protein ABJZ55_02030 [Fuerstiella sp.]